jgi:xanthine dehydrogenase small subunit
LLKFILNNEEVSTSLPSGYPLLDFIRYQRHCTGTKIGCREGDCGACSVLVGELAGGRMHYRSATSCLMAIGNAAGRHIVTVEGTNGTGLNPIQQAFADEGASQCGFCTPGFMVSLAGFCLNGETEPTLEKGIDAVNGNICRCTGYKSIERAIGRISEKLKGRNGAEPLAFAVASGFLPEYFLSIPDRLAKLQSGLASAPANGKSSAKWLSGGTDLYVQQHEHMAGTEPVLLAGRNDMRQIVREGSRCRVGGAVTVTDLLESPVFLQHFPNLEKHIRLVSSTPIRNMATIAGNFANASPIGDFTIFFLALDATLVLAREDRRRELPLRQFYKAYKQLDKDADEIIAELHFELPDQNTFFHFEKVCKRTHLDIASVNTALQLRMENGLIASAHLSAGGVGPTPAYLSAASAFLAGKKPAPDTVDECVQVALGEIAPISDVRGTSDYKSFLLGQLIRAHFMECFPEMKEKLMPAL